MQVDDYLLDSNRRVCGKNDTVVVPVCETWEPFSRPVSSLCRASSAINCHFTHTSSILIADRVKEFAADIECVLLISWI